MIRLNRLVTALLHVVHKDEQGKRHIGDMHMELLDKGPEEIDDAHEEMRDKIVEYKDFVEDFFQTKNVNKIRHLMFDRYYNDGEFPYWDYTENKPAVGRAASQRGVAVRRFSQDQKSKLVDYNYIIGCKMIQKSRAALELGNDIFVARDRRVMICACKLGLETLEESLAEMVKTAGETLTVNQVPGVIDDIRNTASNIESLTGNLFSKLEKLMQDKSGKYVAVTNAGDTVPLIDVVKAGALILKVLKHLENLSEQIQFSDEGKNYYLFQVEEAQDYMNMALAYLKWAELDKFLMALPSSMDVKGIKLSKLGSDLNKISRRLETAMNKVKSQGTVNLPFDRLNHKKRLAMKMKMKRRSYYMQ